MAMRRFDTPAAPLGWAGQGAELIRIVDPTGRAIAWLVPGFGANCVGYAVRRDDGTWQHILHSGTPRDLHQNPLAHGCAILGPEPDSPGSAHRATWQFIERDPTTATCAVRCAAVRLELSARLDDAALHLALLATSDDNGPTPIALGLRLCLASEFRRETGGNNGTGQPSTFVGEDSVLRLSIVANADLGGRWHIDQLAQNRIAVEAWGAAMPDALRAPGEPCRFAVVVVAGESHSARLAPAPTTRLRAGQ